MKYLILTISDIIEKEFEKIDIILERGAIGIDYETGIHDTCSFDSYQLDDYDVDKIEILIENLISDGIHIVYKINNSFFKINNIESKNLTLYCDINKIDHTKDLIKSWKSIVKFNL